MRLTECNDAVPSCAATLAGITNMCATSARTLSAAKVCLPITPPLVRTRLVKRSGRQDRTPGRRGAQLYSGEAAPSGPRASRVPAVVGGRSGASIVLAQKERAMPTITVRNVPSKVVQSLKALARRHNRSMEQEVRDLIEGYVV